MLLPRLVQLSAVRNALKWHVQLDFSTKRMPMLCQESCRFRMLFSKPFDGFFRSWTQKPKRLPLAWLAEQHVFFGTFVFGSPPCLMARDHKSSTNSAMTRVQRCSSHNSALARSLEDILLYHGKGLRDLRKILPEAASCSPSPTNSSIPWLRIHQVINVEVLAGNMQSVPLFIMALLWDGVMTSNGPTMKGPSTTEWNLDGPINVELAVRTCKIARMTLQDQLRSGESLSGRCIIIPEPWRLKRAELSFYPDKTDNGFHSVTLACSLWCMFSRCCVCSCVMLCPLVFLVEMASR